MKEEIVKKSGSCWLHLSDWGPFRLTVEMRADIKSERQEEKSIYIGVYFFNDKVYHVRIKLEG